MSVIANCPGPSLWQQICQEFEEERRRMTQTSSESSEALLRSQVQDFNCAKHHPVLVGRPFAPITGDFSIKDELDPAVGHPASAGYWLGEDAGFSLGSRKQSACEAEEDTPSAVDKTGLPDKKTCSNREFLHHYVWPTLLPALESTLTQSKLEGCFGLKRVSFNSLDFLTEYLYNNNPLHAPDRAKIPLMEIPFVQKWLAICPRPPQPISLTWTESETAVKIQSAWRGYAVRRQPEVQELRKWQEEWRFINRESRIQEEVSGFWERMMPESTRSTSQLSSSGTMASKRFSHSVSRGSLPSGHKTNSDEDNGSLTSSSLQGSVAVIDGVDVGDGSVDESA